MSDLVRRLKSAISIPEYFSKFIDSKIDLLETSSINCPFHADSKPSFTYSDEKKLWRCWSGPHCGGGDVITLHQRNYHLRTREDAIRSLAEMLGLSAYELNLSRDPVKPDELVVKLNSYIHRADAACRTVEDYINLDFIMSQKRPTHELIDELEKFLKVKGVII